LLGNDQAATRLQVVVDILLALKGEDSCGSRRKFLFHWGRAPGRARRV
jgi:hypothetical protein